ncbi:DUF7344 domain-containing protein [Natronosalvus rutilus]|uniref:DUF7344 domain-containing protein n=1 Tax=Natronosalvus rutilus TaxID=2953753 RepID=A0A9E7N9Y5_9EURY|nr:hypothetical protein [Natronosalvus rutilus]UTF53179.1 hypothetical protein NGM29_15600 [Natronosalvus rutilus]
MTQPPEPEPGTHGACSELAFDLLEWLGEQPESAATIDETLRAVAAERRRLLLSVLEEHEQELTLPDAAEEVAQCETGKPITELSAERVANVYISLYHDHLPRLVDAGLLEYDQERDLVAPASF